jgi:predicted dehydrogenase
MKQFNRREFLGMSAGATLSLAMLRDAEAQEPRAQERRARPQPQPVEKVSPNEIINVACLGVRGRGMSHVDYFARSRETRVVTICDVDENVIGNAMKTVEAAQGKPPEFVKDLRRVMDDKSVHVVSIATPNHWHALATIWACQSGKDAYVEKPVSHNVREGRKMVEAARKYKRIVQAGTQIRSSEAIREAMDYLHTGKLGTIYMAKGLCYKPRGSIGKCDGNVPVPAGVDYNLWLGPAPHKPIRRKQFHYDWHWLWDYGNGDLGNQGIHQMDVARWGLNKKQLPNAVFSSGGRFGYEDDGETPNTQLAIFEYGDCVLQFEVRGLVTNDDGNREMGVRIGNIFYGTQGYMIIPSYSSWQVYNPDGSKGAGGNRGGDHFGNFLKAVRSRQHTDLNGDIEEGHLSSALCHFANMSYRLGRKLHVDPKKETCNGDSDANRLLSRDYRKPFAVPRTV